MKSRNDEIEGRGCAAPPCSPAGDRKTAFRVRLNEGLHAAITDPSLRVTIYRIVEAIDQATTSVFWDSDQHMIEFVGDGWALEFHQENDSINPAFPYHTP